MNDDVFYNQVAEEIQAKKMLPGLWTKAFAEAGGDTERTRAVYIKLRVAQLVYASRKEAFKNHYVKVRSDVSKILVFVFIAIATGAGVGAVFSFFFNNEPDRIYTGVACSFATFLCAFAAAKLWNDLRKK